MPGAMVRVMRYQYAQGDRGWSRRAPRRPTTRAQYRVWGLNPGDYYVTAVARIDIGFGGGGRGGRAAEDQAARARRGVANAVGGLLGGNVAALIGGPGDDQDRRVRADLLSWRRVDQRSRRSASASSQEVARHRLQPAAGAHVADQRHVTNPDGSPADGGNVTLMPEGAAGGRGLGTNFGAASTGTAASRSATCRRAATCCGRAATTARCRSSPSQPLAVAGGDLSDLTSCCRPARPSPARFVFEPTQAVGARPDAVPHRRAVRPSSRTSAQSQRPRRQGRRLHARRRAGRAASDSAERRRLAAGR